MRRIASTLLIAVISFSTIADEPLPAPRHVSEHVWAWIGPYGPPTDENRGFRMNLGFVAGDNAVAVIDSGYGDAMAQAMIERIESVSDDPVRHVINTDSQPHRVMGNAVFREHGARIIAGAGAVERIVEQGPAFASIIESVLGLAPGSVGTPGQPDEAIDEPRSIDLGGVTIEVTPAGHAHTDGSLVVHVRPDNIVFAGDVLYGGRLLSVLPESSVEGWIEAFDRMREFGDAEFIPGHGEPGPLSAFEHPTYDYLVTLKRHMDQALEDFVDMQDAIDSLDQSAWRDLADFESLAGRNAHQSYLQSEAASF